MFRTFTMSVPIVATATVTVSAEDWVAATELAHHILSGKDVKVVHPYDEVAVMLDFDHDLDEATTMSEEERNR